MKHDAARLVTKDLNFMADLAPADFFRFPKLKLPPRGTHFQSVQEIKENSRRERTQFRKQRLKNVVMIGLFVGVRVSFLKEHTLKVIKEIWMNSRYFLDRVVQGLQK
jgi:hypothetical protein